MKKSILVVFALMLALSFVCAADAPAGRSSTNVNRIVAGQWKEMRTITFSGVNPLPILVVDVAKTESISLSDDGFLKIVGKKDEKGSQVEVNQVSYFAYNVTIKTSVITDSQTKKTTTVKDMLIYLAPTGKLF